jgi:ABC-type glycerol-3-phosphate transport system substrate-binding protein
VSGRRQLAAALTAAGLALGAGACGSDEEPTTTSATTTEETVSSTSSTTESTTSSTTTTESTTAQTTTEQTTTTTDEIELEPTEDGSGGGSGNGPRGDSETNDKPPQEGSPEESFEEFCDLNPKECG